VDSLQTDRRFGCAQVTASGASDIGAALTGLTADSYVFYMRLAA